MKFHARRLNPRFAPPLSLWMDLATRSSEMLWASGEVIAHRSRIMANMGADPSASDQREMQRMVEEKISASADSAMAMSFRAAEVCQSMMLRSMQPWMGSTHAASPNDVTRAAAQITQAGLAPFHQRARSNAKRLRR